MTFQPTGFFEAHLSVRDRAVSAEFYKSVLGCEPALEIPDRDVTFLWMDGRGSSMLGLWGPNCPNPPITQSVGHFAMRLPLEEIIKAPAALLELGITPLDLDGQPTAEAIVIGWMPAASVYFKDPDGHSLEFLCMLDEAPRPELGIMTIGEWKKAY